jgi:hypothetical protein
MTATASLWPAGAGPLTRHRDAIGFVGVDVPVEVLLASGRPFGHLPWQTDGDTPWADSWLESGFPGWARSILQQWHDGTFDELSVVVFSRADDASQRLYYYVRELQARGALRGPEAVIFDLALVPREASFLHSARSVTELARHLDVSDDVLSGGIERANLLRSAMLRLQQSRAAHGPYHERIGRAALWSDASKWIDAVAPASGTPVPRVLLAGSMPPDDRLHRAVEEGGGCVVFESHVHALGRLGPPLQLQGEVPAHAIARHLIRHSTGPRAFQERDSWIVRQAREANCAAVILWLTREDEALAWQLPAQRRALEAAGLPALVLPAARWLADDGAPDHIRDFCRRVLA